MKVGIGKLGKISIEHRIHWPTCSLKGLLERSLKPFPILRSFQLPFPTTCIHCLYSQLGPYLIDIIYFTWTVVHGDTVIEIKGYSRGFHHMSRVQSYKVLSTKCSSDKPVLFPFEVGFIFRDEHFGKVSEVRLEIIFLSF